MMTDTRHTPLLILGAGPAGYTAAIYAARAMRKPVLLQGLEPGGQMTITTDVENYPGFEKVVQGPWLMEQMEAQARLVGAELLTETATEVNLSVRPFAVTCESGARFTSDALIIATGAQAKWLGLDSEETFKGFGVSACATCDGFFFRDKEVIVVGGGNTAVEEALFLTKFASRVLLIHRRDTLRAEKILQERLMAHEKIKILWNTRLEEVIGEANPKSVSHARLHNIKTGAETRHACEGVFIAIGHAPQTALFKGQIEMDASGVILTQKGSTQTSLPGVFAAGDVADDIYRQAVTAAGMGCMAALDAERFLDALHASQTPA